MAIGVAIEFIRRRHTERHYNLIRCPDGWRREGSGLNMKTRILKILVVSAALTAFLNPAAFAAAGDENVCTGDPSQWRQLFDGKDLNGWKHVGPGSMTGTRPLRFAKPRASARGASTNQRYGR